MIRDPERVSASVSFTHCRAPPTIRASSASRTGRPSRSSASVPGDRLRGTVPELHLALEISKCNAIRKAVQCGLKKFRAIGHPALSLLFIGSERVNFITLAVRENVGICS